MVSGKGFEEAQKEVEWSRPKAPLPGEVAFQTTFWAAAAIGAFWWLETFAPWFVAVLVPLALVYLASRHDAGAGWRRYHEDLRYAVDRKRRQEEQGISYSDDA